MQNNKDQLQPPYQVDEQQQFQGQFYQPQPQPQQHVPPGQQQQQQQQFFNYQPPQQLPSQTFYRPPQQVQIQLQNFEFQKPKIRKRRPGITRRRTVTACEYCRSKKIKCDLVKPTCGSCKKSTNQCVYRSNNKPHEDKITSLAEVKKAAPPKWSSCNWYSKLEGVLEWPIFESKFNTHHTKDINTLLCEFNDIDIPVSNSLADEDLRLLNEDFKLNLGRYVDEYCNNVQNKNPFIDLTNLYATVEYLESVISTDPEIYLFDVVVPASMVPLPIIVIGSASSLLSKPLSLKNLETYQNSNHEKKENYELSFKFMLLAKYLNILPATKINDFDVHIVQFYLMEANFWMYNMKPFKAWDSIFRASTTVMTILESYKSSGRKFSENEHRILERVFHTCLKYESELRVELSPSIPASGIVNYDFPTIYPTPPLNGSLSLNEELSWFFYLTEIVLRKLENRILDDLYVPESNPNDDEADGEFLKDRHKLSWNTMTPDELVGKITGFLEDFSKIEVNIETHLRLILHDDATSNETFQRHGYVFKPVDTKINDDTPNTSINSTTPTTSTTSIPSTSEIDTTPTNDSEINSGDSSNTTPRSSEGTVRLPEVLNFMQTRMITLKMLLFRPIGYFIMNVDASIAQSPFVQELLQQSGETMDLLNVQLAAHRHFGSWFYLRNSVMGCVLCFGLFKKLGAVFCPKKKVEGVCLSALVVLNYWREEAPYLERSLEIVNEILAELDDF